MDPSGWAAAGWRAPSPPLAGAPDSEVRAHGPVPAYATGCLLRPAYAPSACAQPLRRRQGSAAAPRELPRHTLNIAYQSNGVGDTESPGAASTYAPGLAMLHGI
jgi:hypothetical protein